MWQIWLISELRINFIGQTNFFFGHDIHCFFVKTRYLWEPMGNIHFAGEGISFTQKWIQGALESGLKAAYQVYERHMDRNGHHV